jgi:outer membrane biosynthesis protein TonB
VTSAMALRVQGTDGLSRKMTWSFAVHLALVVGLFLAPSNWLKTQDPPPQMMTVNLGGSAGERTGGMTAAGAQPVEEVAPPPKRPEPKPVVAPKPETALAVPKTPQKVEPSKSPVTSTAVMTPRPPVTGAQPTPGTSRAYTGSTSQTTGLSIGGGVGGASASVPTDFCCPQYIEELLRRISANWKRVQPEQGTTTIKFVINRDGTFSRPEVEVSSGSVLLDVTSRDAFNGLRLDPLPRAYSEDKLTIHLRFPYVR